MSQSPLERLLLWPFFEQIEKELSYERWIDKYRLFQQTLASGAIPYDKEWTSFRRFCKHLYLQDQRHESRFDELLRAAIPRHKAQLLQLMLQVPVVYFLPFFEQLENELGYEFDADQFRLFQQALAAGEVPFDKDWVAFRRFCKQHFLQNTDDEARFDALLDQAIAAEKAALKQALQPTAGPDSPTQRTSEESSTPPSKPGDTPTDRSSRPRPDSETSTTMPTPEPATETKYFHPSLEGMEVPSEDLNPGAPATSDRFLHTDEYFPTNRRELVKSWQYLRRRERGSASLHVDIPATVERIGRDGLFTDIMYEPAYVNRRDTLYLFADTRGSMTPFHELSKRLIDTAQGEGGHRRAPVYYFQNAPLEHLYRRPNLTYAVPLSTALLRANPNLSYAFIISDGGAARGQKNSEQIDRRLRLLRPFLELLKVSTAHTIWLNPMPEHRWPQTAAAAIAEEPTITAMVPVLEEGNYNYQDVIRRIIKYKEV